MKPITQEWVEKAEEDWNVLERLLRARKSPTYDAVCFHAQQCAEKYLKARLQEASIPSPKTHSLPALLTLVRPVEPSWHVLQPALLTLDDYSVDFRYPGKSASRVDAREAKRLCADIRKAARLSLGLPVG